MGVQTVSKRELCHTQIATTLAASPISIAAASIERGQNMNPRPPTPYALVRCLSRPKPVLLSSGGKIRDYKFEVVILVRQRDKTHVQTLDAALQTLLDKVEEAFDGKTVNTFPTLTGLRTVTAEVAATSQRTDEAYTEQEGRVTLTFSFTEAN
jgi:hypothetical protein